MEFSRRDRGGPRGGGGDRGPPRDSYRGGSDRGGGGGMGGGGMRSDMKLVLPPFHQPQSPLASCDQYIQVQILSLAVSALKLI